MVIKVLQFIAIIVTIFGGALLNQVGTWSPGAFRTIIMISMMYGFARIYNHPVMLQLREQKPATVPVAIRD